MKSLARFDNSFKLSVKSYNSFNPSVRCDNCIKPSARCDNYFKPLVRCDNSIKPSARCDNSFKIIRKNRHFFQNLTENHNLKRRHQTLSKIAQTFLQPHKETRTLKSSEMINSFKERQKDKATSVRHNAFKKPQKRFNWGRGF